MKIKDYEIKEITDVKLITMEEAKARKKEVGNKFYKVERNMVKVSEQEFIDFINNYPRPLDRDVYGVCDPPSITYNDFELANRWPYSIVASTHMFSDDPNDYYYYPPEEREFRILKNYQECFDSKTGYKED